jgi:hypothetical protein
VPIGGLDVLVYAAVAWELSRVCGQLRSRSFRHELVFGVMSLKIVPASAGKFIVIGRAHVEVRSFKFVVLLGDQDEGGLCFLLVEAFAIDCIFCEGRFDDMHFAEMPSALTLLTETNLGMVMAKIAISQFPSSPSKNFLLLPALRMVMFGIDRSISLRIFLASLYSSLIPLSDMIFKSSFKLVVQKLLLVVAGCLLPACVHFICDNSNFIIKAEFNQVLIMIIG